MDPGEADAALSQLTLGKSALPADDKSLVTLTLTAKDKAGNPLADGTVVVWEAGEDTDGEFVEAQEATQGGVATVKYRVGIDPGMKTLRARVDDVVLEQQVQQVPLGVTLIAPTTRNWHDRTPQELRVRRQTRPGLGGGGIGLVVTTVNLVEQTQGLVAGEARARWKYETVTHRPRGGLRGGYREGPRAAAHDLDPDAADCHAGPAGPGRELPGGGLLPGPARARTCDLGRADGDRGRPGTRRNRTVRASGRDDRADPRQGDGAYKLTGLVPGERVSVRLGSSRNPNVLPVLHFNGDALVEGVVPDLTGTHDGQASPGVSLAYRRATRAGDWHSMAREGSGRARCGSLLPGRIHGADGGQAATGRCGCRRHRNRPGCNPRSSRRVPPRARGARRRAAGSDHAHHQRGRRVDDVARAGAERRRGAS